MSTQLVVKASKSGKTSNLFLRAFGKDVKVIGMWESFSGWYWYITEKCEKQDSVMSDGSVYEGDQIYFGFIQGLEEEWGYFAESQLQELKRKHMAWKVPKTNWTFAGRGDRLHETA